MFDETVVYFTPSASTINSKITTKSLLKVYIVPTRDKVNIESIKISYVNDSVHINEEVDDINMFTSLVYSMKGDGDTLTSRAKEYINQLQEDEVSVIVKEYSKYIKEGIVFDALIAGIGSYVALLSLMENGAFVGQLPFEFGVPWRVDSGNAVNGNMFRYMSLPLASLRKISQGILLQLTLFVESFINIWGPLFHPGPIIGTNTESKACIEIISGFSQHILSMGDSLKEYVIQNSDTATLKTILEDASNKIVEMSHKLEESTKRIDELSEQLENVKLTLNTKQTTPPVAPNIVHKGVVQWHRK